MGLGNLARGFKTASRGTPVSPLPLRRRRFCDAPPLCEMFHLSFGSFFGIVRDVTGETSQQLPAHAGSLKKANPSKGGDAKLPV